MTEDDLEQLALTWFQDSGWDYLHGPDIAPDSDTPERADYRQVLLPGHLHAALHRLNPTISETILDEVAHHLAKPDHPSLILSNRAFHEALIVGMPVEVEIAGEKRGDRVQVIDFEHPERNRFVVVNQFTVQGSKQPRRPDLVCFINGLPVAVIELKNPANEQADIWAAYNQLQTYKEEVTDLFVSNEALVISDGLHARIGSLTASRERFLPWRTVKNENDRPLLEFELEKVVRGFFSPELLLDYLRYFVLFETADGQVVKKIAGYHQFHAVRAAVKAAVIAATQPAVNTAQDQWATYAERVKPGSRMGGIVWHTQGSGKSISMVCFAAKLMQQREMQNPTLVVVTDRNDLDGQLFQTFVGARSLLRETPQQATNRDELRALLADRPSGGIIFTTVQKFTPEPGEAVFPLLSERTNIVVIADEAHRSQYGFRAVLDKKTGQYKYGFAKHLRDALKNATFVGFTGTPVEGADKDTRAVFGDYVSIYDIQDAVDDGATVPIFYESRLAKLDLNPAEMEQLNADVEEVFEDEEDAALKEAAKTRWAALEKLVGAQPRIDQVAADIVQHFEARNGAVEGKAMIVAMSREICARLYAAIVTLRPAWHSDDPALGAIKVVMTGSAADTALLQPHIYNATTKKLLEKRFKDASFDNPHPLKIVIVRDMWLTGFDVPCLHTMYVDKPMRDHNLMQAIARVNRVFHDKEGGLVVDYIGIAAELRSALRSYTESKGKGQPALDAAEALAKLKELMDVARGLLHGFDFGAYRTKAAALLLPAANFVLGLEDGKKRWADAVLAITKAFSLCGTLDEAIVLREEIAFFQAIKAVIAKATESDKKLSEDRKNAVLKQTGLCIRTGYWTPALARIECDPDLIAKPMPAPKPVAAPSAPPAPEAGAASASPGKGFSVEFEKEIPTKSLPLELMPSLSKVGIVKVYFGTDRMPSGRSEPIKYYGERADTKLNLGIAYVSMPLRPVHTSGGFEEPKWWKLEFRPNPAKHIVLQHISVYSDRQGFVDRLRQDVTKTKGKELFVFIHGFNVKFEEAARRTAQISYDLDLDVTPVLFSWATAGRVLGYGGDEDMSDQAVARLQEFLQVLLQNAGAEAIHLIAHSMGNRFMARAVNQLSMASRDERRPFNQIIMAAPDVKKEAFEQVLGPALRKSSCHTTLYLSSKDKAIWLSSAVVHQNERIGSVAPAFEKTEWIDAIDASNVNHDLLGLNHSYYGMAAMLDDIRMVLRRIAAPRFTLADDAKLAPNHWQLGRKKSKRQSGGYLSEARRLVCPQ